MATISFREAAYRLLTDVHAAAAREIRRRGGSWADVESFLNMAPMTAERAYGPLIEAADGPIGTDEDGACLACGTPLQLCGHRVSWQDTRSATARVRNE